jgi:hypothetical protein
MNQLKAMNPIPTLVPKGLQAKDATDMNNPERRIFSEVLTELVICITSENLQVVTAL